MAISASVSTQRTSEASTRSRSSTPGRRPDDAAAPMRTTWDKTDTPMCDRSSLAMAPTATRAAVSRAEARSSTSRASVNPYFCMPARSA